MSNLTVHNKANKLKNAGKIEEAKELYKSNFTFLLSQFEYSSCLILEEKYEESEIYISNQLLINPQNFYLYFNLSILYKRKTLYKRALEYIDRFLSNKQTPEAEFIKSEILLSMGNQFGIYLYEERLRCSNYKVKKIPESNRIHYISTKIKELTVVAEGGYGDVIMFSRYILVLIRRGISVTLVCQKQLVNLMKLLHKDIKVTTKMKLTRYMCYIMSLPKLLDIDYRSSYCDKYINVCREKELYWSSKISGRKSIGIAWEGKDSTKTYRNLSFEILSKINFQNLSVYSLQKNAREILSGCIDYTDEFFDFSDTAALINSLTLVITIDTSIAHLAGALGKEVILLLSYNHCWRWNYSLYPKIRIIKQKKLNNWDSSIDEVNEIISEYK